MPVWLEWIFYILIVVVMLGVLIAIHEAGHLATAKLFRVYCFEYSIGMGPKIFSKKRKGGESTFSIRAGPFGGYVAIYGEPGAVPGERPFDDIGDLLVFLLEFLFPTVFGGIPGLCGQRLHAEGFLPGARVKLPGLVQKFDSVPVGGVISHNMSMFK